ncbi:MAG: hypothetical protein LBS81_03665 [Endomicrobium sp.]|jgi:hypothetical protein|nr:hypothetical protein [Endomicrobium sp.]
MKYLRIYGKFNKGSIKQNAGNKSGYKVGILRGGIVKDRIDVKAMISDGINRYETTRYIR